MNAVTSNLPYVAPVGATGAPSYTFAGDTTTGIYHVGANDVGVTTNGVLRLDVSSTLMTSSVKYTNTAQPSLYVVASGVQSIGNSSATTFTTYSTPITNVGFTSFSSGVLTIATAGTYVINVTGGFAANATGNRLICITHNGTSERLAQSFLSNAGGTFPTATSNEQIVTLSATDTLRVQVFQNSGGSLNTMGSNTTDDRFSFSVAMLF
jgi:hypothetical protein